VSRRFERALLSGKRLATVARAQQRSLAEVVQAALAEWLADQEKKEQARQLMRKLGQGLGQGPADGTVARDHDTHLYSRDPV
jgi:Arc/MetJ-type ribon-helix-helix transcriptional regulator